MEPETAPPITNNKNLLVLLLILVVILIAGASWYFFLQKSNPETKQSNGTTATTSAKGAAANSQPSSSVADDNLIKEALVAKTGIASDTIDVSISQKVDTFAKGSVGTKGEETGGGYFLAVKVSGVWIIVYNGQATPNCIAVNPYNFPTTMVPECLDSSGNLITRQ